MTLYLVYVKSSIDPLTGQTVKSIANIRVPTGKVPMSSTDLSVLMRTLIGDSIGIWIKADDSSEIESKLIESGFKSSFDFISNYSKVI